MRCAQIIALNLVANCESFCEELIVLFPSTVLDKRVTFIGGYLCKQTGLSVLVSASLLSSTILDDLTGKNGWYKNLHFNKLKKKSMFGA